MQHSPCDHARRHDRRELSAVGAAGRPAVASLLLACALAVTGSSPVAGQESAIDRAREAQRDFERVRRRNFARGDWDGGRCDEHIGRFCLTHDDDDWSPTPEHPAVIEARAHLIQVLDSVALSPEGGEPWLAGQRVKYLLEAEEPDRALEAAASCPGDLWWCDALLGLVHHARGETRGAERAFDSAASRMPTDTLCRWEDLRALLVGDDRDAYEEIPCGTPARRSFERSFWHLSDPLWSTPGPERRMEHLARQVWRGIQSDAASGYGLSWGDDIDEITVRYGWPAGWDVAWRRDPGIRTERSIEAHRAPHAQRFAVRGVAGEPTWDLDDEEPRSTWALPAGSVAAPEGVQLAVFRRGEARLVVGAVRPGADRACGDEFSLVLSSGEHVIAAARRRRAIALLEPDGGAARFVGIEVECDGDPAVLRVRGPIGDVGKWLSDLLLLDPSESLPGTLDATLRHVRPDGVVRPGESIVVFWEWYGPADPMTVTLTLSRENKGFWRKALEFMGLAESQIERTGVRWSDVGPAGESPRAMKMQLPDLAEGEYSLTLHVQSARIGTVSSSREIVVER